MELKEKLEEHGRTAEIYGDLGDCPSLSITYKDNEEFQYAIRVSGLRPTPESQFTDMRNGKRYNSKGYLRSGLQDYTIADISKEEIIKHFLYEYKNYVGYMTKP